MESALGNQLRRLFALLVINILIKSAVKDEAVCKLSANGQNY
jgi:hypothetical protein